ncbi:nudC domain-containing protein 1 isoform X1 [Xenopus tropicalis]|uniref:NudC domain-containing protein 1 n=1 Tax=Xenopus tropicalis TaxID=8364 RepID=A0A8J1JMY3_XENTR|nr:nudC domain-containing protein 1 isoform X1 [Xenopus tropicalis]
MEGSNCSLRVNRQLLDPKFESYKLSLDPLPCYNVELDAAVAEVCLRDDQYTLDHMRAFGMYNYLHCNPWIPNSVFYVDQLERVMSFTVTLDTAMGKPIEVFRFPRDLNTCDSRLCSSMYFASAQWVTLSDGTGTLYIIRIGNQSGSVSGKWEIMFNQELGEPFIVVHSVSSVRDELHIIDVLLLSIEKDESDIKGSGFHVCLEWVSIARAQNEDNGKYEILKRRKLFGKSVPHYAAIEPLGNGVMMISYKPFRFIANDKDQPESSEDEKMDEDNKREPLYNWHQTGEDVTLTFQLPEGMTKEDLTIKFLPGEIDISLKDQGTFLKGQLYLDIDCESSAWIIKEGRSVEVTLTKREPGSTWAELVIGDKHGEYIVDPTQTAAIAEQLMHLTSEDMNPETEKPPCNAQELEECDLFLEDSTSLCRFDGARLKATHVVNLGSNPYLFTFVATPELMPCFALRHDVDALLWQPVSEQADNLWDHIATFNALGYVQASKQDKKFFTCAPNFSYSALCECVRRIFIYRQPTPVSTELYNRKEGRRVGQVAKQQVASLETTDPIVGFQASNERLFVLTTKKLSVIKVNSTD